jgi:hypothetical protein
VDPLSLAPSRFNHHTLRMRNETAVNYHDR